MPQRDPRDIPYIKDLWMRIREKVKTSPEGRAFTKEEHIVNHLKKLTGIRERTLWDMPKGEGNFQENTLDTLVAFLDQEAYRTFYAFKAYLDTRGTAPAAGASAQEATPPGGMSMDDRLFDALYQLLGKDGTLSFTFKSSDVTITGEIKSRFRNDDLLQSNGFGGATLYTIIITDAEVLRRVLVFYESYKASLDMANVRIGKEDKALNNYLSGTSLIHAKTTANHATMTEEDARRYIVTGYPSAKFNAYTHTNEFMDLEANIGKGFYYVSLYDELFESTLIDTAKGVLLASNTYEASHAYNVVLAWIHAFRKKGVFGEGTDPLIKYNLKKFYAEQLYHHYDNVFSRAVLLETLLYEQHLMKPVFEETEQNDDWKDTADQVAGMMSSLVLFHELGHYYLNHLPDVWKDLSKQHEQLLNPFLQAVEEQYAPVIAKGLFVPAFMEEVKCDILSLYSCLMQHQQDKEAMVFALRSAVIGFALMALFYSVKLSAKMTTEEHQKEPDDVEFNSIETSTREYAYILEDVMDNTSASMLERARLMASLCASIAREEGVQLYGVDGKLPLHADILDYLFSYTKSVMEPNNINERNMARLIAEGFHNHPEGMRYLYLKSKVFKSRRSLQL